MVPLFAETSPVHALIEPTRVSGTGCPACVGHDCLRFGNAGLYARNACPVCVMACRIETTNLRHDRHRGSNFCPVHALLRVVSCMEWLIDGLLFPRRERCHRRCNAVTPGAGIAVRQRFVPVQARTSGAPNDRRVRIIGINFCPGHDALTMQRGHRSYREEAISCPVPSRFESRVAGFRPTAARASHYRPSQTTPGGCQDGTSKSMGFGSC